VSRDWKQRRRPFAFRWFLPGVELALSFALVYGWAVAYFLLRRPASEVRLIAPALLNSPATLLGLARRELVPRGMLPEFWRALTWPVAGTAFWWIVGRAWEALAAARKRSLSPVLTWIEVSVGAVLVLMFGGFGIRLVVTSDREGTIFPWKLMAAACLLWGGLGLSVLVARIVQGRLRKRMRRDVVPGRELTA
jgi:hypothetical protein